MALNLSSTGKKIGPLSRDYTWRDAVLYALGVGAGFEDLEYAYEGELKIVPSFSIAAVFDFLAEVGVKSEANLGGILHGEQDIVFHAPIPTSGRLTTEGAIHHIYDKGKDKGAVVMAKADTWHSDGQKLFTNDFTLFCRKDGGFGGENVPSEPFEFPDRDPDFEEKATPAANQPLLYRLSGDTFQLHADPHFARTAGFDMPIMHGLCTHGYACRAVIKHLFPHQPERMTRFKTRFSRPLYPGVSINTQIWKIDDGVALFKVLNASSGEVVIDRGLVTWLSAEESARRAARTGIRFDGQVAVVTGAGAGLGRVYALELAKRGAKVVVNDLGGNRDGSGASTSAADTVVAEIKKAGGEAVANYDSVATPEGGAAIVQTAITAFGRLDILINNAGILRDKSFLKLTPDDWNSVLAVHLDGAYNVTRPAFEKMKEQNYGRVVVTTSVAGLHGNFGQTNYSAAKMGLVGFMNTLKLEGEKYGIKVNAVAPVATTRLTEDILPPEMQAKLAPEFVAPMTLYLCSELCPVSGHIYNAGFGFFNRAALVNNPGVVLGDSPATVTPEAVAKQIKTISTLKDPSTCDNAIAFVGFMQQAMSSGGTKAAPAAEGYQTVQAVIDAMPTAFQKDKAAGVDVTFLFQISGPQGGEWSVKIKDGTCEAQAGTHGTPTTTIIMKDEDLLAWMNRKLNAMQAYTAGKIKIKGDLMKSQLVEKLFAF